MHHWPHKIDWCSGFFSPQKDYMENKKAAVELKDVPSPLHAGSKLFQQFHFQILILFSKLKYSFQLSPK